MATAVTDEETPPDAEEERDGGEMTHQGHLLELRSRVTWMAGAIVVGMCIFLLPPINFAVWDFLLERALSSPPDFIPLITEPLEVFGAYYPVDMELLGVGAAEAFVVLVIALIVVGPQRFPEIARQGGRYFRMARRYASEVTSDVRGAMAELEAEVEQQKEELQAAHEEIATGLSTSIAETRSEIENIGREAGDAVRDAPAAQTRAQTRAQEVQPDPAGNGASPPAAAAGGLRTPRELPASDAEGG